MQVAGQSVWRGLLADTIAFCLETYRLLLIAMPSVQEENV